ncbi:NUDIX hydrolase [Clostridium sp. WILCCON 0269]|uniref:NUDIX hydrolase n=1 Tax=Candidatus Clostridium eludens TaxID=3381663 RepID=A0ABW8SNS5_9CLOT
MIKRIEHIFKHRKPDIIGDFTKNAVMIPLCESGKELSILFEVRALDLRHQPGDICFPGGKVEEGEIPVRAAIRETLEELNLSREDINLIGQMDYIVAPYNFIMYPFVCKLNKEYIVPSESEVDHIFKVPLQFFVENEPLLHEVPIVSQPGKKFPYNLIRNGRNYKFRRGKVKQYFYSYEEYVIWGFTALIIKRFVDIIVSNE